MTEKKNDVSEAEDTGPCPPLGKISGDEQADVGLAEESAADFDADEKDEDA
jgi:hypothetical protein